MDSMNLHRAASEAALFQRAALAHLSYDNTALVRRHGQELAELLAALGFVATPRTADAEI